MILSIETSASVCSVALHSVAEGSLCFNANLQQGRTHARALTQLIAHAWAVTGTNAAALKAVALSAGPGSYTGLRIGAATVKGLCYGTKKPLIAVSTLGVLAKSAAQYAKIMPDNNTLLCPLIDARRMEVYTALFDQNCQTLTQPTAKIIDKDSFGVQVETHTVLFFGSGAQKCASVICHKNAVFLDGIQPDAVQVGELALQKFSTRQFDDLAYFEPFYLKAFQTQAKGVQKKKA